MENTSLIMKKISCYFCCLALLLLIGCANEPAPKAKSESDNKAQPTASTPSKANVAKKKNIIFFGNSLSAGYGLDPSEGFVGLVEKRIDSLGLDYKVINAGLSGETTAGGKSRVEWILDRQSVDIFILELGGNDMLRGTDYKQSYQNLKSIVVKVKTKYPKAKLVIAGMLAPPNMGPEYTEGFKEMYPKLAKDNDAALIPFLLDGVGGISSLNLPDGIHPNVEGHKIVTENVWRILEPLL